LPTTFKSARLTTGPIRTRWSSALKLPADPIILVHNARGGGPTLSRADSEMTKWVIEIACGLGIAVQRLL